jgi:hypothetical protein
MRQPRSMRTPTLYLRCQEDCRHYISNGLIHFEQLFSGNAAPKKLLPWRRRGRPSLWKWMWGLAGLTFEMR